MAQYDKADIERRMKGAVESLKSDLEKISVISRKGLLSESLPTPPYKTLLPEMFLW